MGFALHMITRFCEDILIDNEGRAPPAVETFGKGAFCDYPKISKPNFCAEILMKNKDRTPPAVETYCQGCGLQLFAKYQSKITKRSRKSEYPPVR